VAEVLRKLLPVFAALPLAAACGGGSSAAEPSAVDSPTDRRDLAQPVVAPRETQCIPNRERRLGTRRTAYAAKAVGTTTALAHPRGRPVHVFGRRNMNGADTVFGVLAVVRDGRCEPAWYHVQLPIRPNGATGYVRADDVLLLRVETRIEVDLSERRVDFFRAGRRLLRAAAGVGAAGTPTPTGRFYVNQRLRAADAGGPFGPGGIGISAFSPVLTSWAQSGPIAVHGTNEPTSIGRAVTHGCLRISNAQLLRMFVAMPEGTPVVIRV
jgi:hypothetical protein